MVAGGVTLLCGAGRPVFCLGSAEHAVSTTRRRPLGPIANYAPPTPRPLELQTGSGGDPHPVLYGRWEVKSIHLNAVLVRRGN